VQETLFAEAKARLDGNIARDVADFAGLERAFAESVRNPGFVEVQWARPTGAALDKVVERLKTLKLTLRNVPMDAAPADGACVFTGEPAVERVLVGRSY
jgi:prolyl-tRNA synthetase